MCGDRIARGAEHPRRRVAGSATPVKMEPATIAALLRELAVYYELDGDRHRAFAYDRAAKAVEAANGLHRLIEEGRLEELARVGASIARVVAELARRGEV